MAIFEEFTEQEIINTEIDDQFSFEPEDGLEDDSDKGKWLYYAINLKVYNSEDPRLEALVDHLFEEIKGFEKLYARVKQNKWILKQVVINLWKANFLEQPVRYARDKNRYLNGSRYKKSFFKHDSLTQVTDALEEYGYNLTAKGRSIYEDKQSGYQTRMWASQVMKDLFQEYQLLTNDFYSEAEIEELVRLSETTKIKRKNKKPKKIKRNVDYRETNTTRQMRNEIEAYNDFVKKNYLTLNLDDESLVSYRLLLHIIRNKLIDNKINLNVVNYEQMYNQAYNQLSSKISTDYLSQLTTDSKNHKVTHTTVVPPIQVVHPEVVSPNKPVIQIPNPTEIPPSHITQEFSCKPFIDEGLYENVCHQWVEAFKSFLRHCHTVLRRDYSVKEIKRLLDTKFQLKDLGIENIQVSLNREFIYRDFARAAQSFKYGGRAYGPLYQGINEDLRKCIRINDQSTVEVDYSAFHIRMLYHLRQEKYTEDPYKACAGLEYRSMYKCAMLTLINAANENSGKTAVQSELKKRGIPLPVNKKPLNWIVAKIKEAHPDIKDDICADWGVKLMNLDSNIMNSVLLRLMEHGILGLSIHDSVIVAEQHEAILKKFMIEEYEKRLGYEPVF